MKRDQAHQAFIEQINKLWKTSTINQETTDDLIQQIRLFDDFAGSMAPIMLLFDMRRAIPLAASQNVLQLGHTPEDVLNMKSRLLFSMINWKHILFPLVSFKWDLNFLTHAPKDKLMENFICQFGGVRLQKKDGTIVPYVFKGRFKFADPMDKFPALGLFHLQDASHLFNSDASFWGRYTCGLGEDAFTRFYKLSLQKSEYDDLLSLREKEIMALVGQNQTTKQIGQVLNLSPFTVDTHRKQIIQRVGVKDSTALLEICKMCQINLGNPGMPLFA